MSEVWRRQYRGMCERGSTTLAGIDAAQVKKLLTQVEADDVRGYWHELFDVVGLGVEVRGDRSQVVSWAQPTSSFHAVQVTRRAGSDERTATVAPLGGPVVFDAPTDQGDVAVEVLAQVVASTGNNGEPVSTSVTVPAVAVAEPAPVVDAAPVADDGSGTAPVVDDAAATAADGTAPVVDDSTPAADSTPVDDGTGTTTAPTTGA